MTNKHKNKKVAINGVQYDSKAEMSRGFELEMLEKAGEIKDLQRQVKFQLQEKFKIQNKTIREITYIADYVYYDNRLKKVIMEDVKNPYNAKADKAFSLKKKMLLSELLKENKRDVIFRVCIKGAKSTIIEDYVI
jgi:hypothetical protein